MPIIHDNPEMMQECYLEEIQALRKALNIEKEINAILQTKIQQQEITMANQATVFPYSI